MTEIVNPYQLNDQEREVWYDTVVRPVFLDGLEVSDHPKFTLITAQCGAGKTTTALRYVHTTSPAPLRFSGDDLRCVHPQSARIMKEDPDNYVLFTTADVSWARSKMLEECMQKKYNIQIDSILTKPEDYKMKTLLQVREYGYQAECVALGVPYFLSAVSMYDRRETQIEQTGIGFPVTLDNHNKAYEYLGDIISKMYEGRFVDSVKIVDRNMNVFYQADHMKNETGEGIKQGLIKARDSFMQKQYLAYTDELWQTIYKKMDARQAPENHYQAADEQYKYFADVCKQSGLYSPQGKPKKLDFLINLQHLKEECAGK